MIPSMNLRIRWRVVVFITAMLTLWLAYLLPWALDLTITGGLLLGWAVAKLLESLS